MKSHFSNNLNNQEKKTQSLHSKKIMKMGAFMSFFGVLIYNIPAYINTLNEKRSGKIQHLDSITTQNIREIFDVMNYEKDSKVLLGSDENYVDIDHKYHTKETFFTLLDTLLVTRKKPEVIHNIPVGRGLMTSYEGRKKVLYAYPISCNISANEVYNLAEYYDLSPEESYSIISMFLCLYLGEKVEKAQSKDIFIILSTKSGYNRNDLNGNILGILQGMNTYKDKKYRISMSRIKEIYGKLEKQYGIGDAQHYLISLSKDFGFTVIQYNTETYY